MNLQGKRTQNVETQRMQGDPLWLILGWTFLLTVLFAWRVWTSGITAQHMLAVIILPFFLFLYLMMGWYEGGEVLRKWVLAGTGRVFIIPVAMWLLFVGYAKLSGHLSDDVGILGLAMAVIPVEIARREMRPLQPKDIIWGWLALLIPLMNPPFGKGISFSLDVGLRIGAFLLPALYLGLARGRWQRLRLLLAFSYIWYSVEWADPDVGFPFFSLFNLYALGMAAYILMVTNEARESGVGLRLRGRELGPVLRNFLLFLPIALGIGIATQFLHPHVPHTAWPDALLRAVLIFFFTGMPEEILFRGVIFRSLAGYLEHPRHALAISALIFGASHLDNPPMVGIYFVLATIAGWFYGDTYLRTGRIAPAALLHAAVDWVWDLAL